MDYCQSLPKLRRVSSTSAWGFSPFSFCHLDFAYSHDEWTNPEEVDTFPAVFARCGLLAG